MAEATLQTSRCTKVSSTWPHHCQQPPASANGAQILEPEPGTLLLTRRGLVTHWCHEASTGIRLPFLGATSTMGRGCFHLEADAEPPADSELVLLHRSWQVQQSESLTIRLDLHLRLAPHTEESKFYRKEAAFVGQTTSTLQLPCSLVQHYRNRCVPLPLCSSHLKLRGN